MQVADDRGCWSDVCLREVRRDCGWCITGSVDSSTKRPKRSRGQGVTHARLVNKTQNCKHRIADTNLKTSIARVGRRVDSSNVYRWNGMLSEGGDGGSGRAASWGAHLR